MEIFLNDVESRKWVEYKMEDGKKEKYFFFYDGEMVFGKVSFVFKNFNKWLEY